MLMKRNRKSFLSKWLETMDSCHFSCFTFPTGSAVIYISIDEIVILMWNSSANNQSKIHASLLNIPAQYFSWIKKWRKRFFLIDIFFGSWAMGLFLQNCLDKYCRAQTGCSRRAGSFCRTPPHIPALSPKQFFFLCRIPFLTRFTRVLKNLIKNQIG